MFFPGWCSASRSEITWPRPQKVNFRRFSCRNRISIWLEHPECQTEALIGVYVLRRGWLGNASRNAHTVTGFVQHPSHVSEVPNRYVLFTLCLALTVSICPAESRRLR